MPHSSHPNDYAQINVHIASSNEVLVPFINAAREKGIAVSTFSEAAIEIAWTHFPNEVQALAQKKAQSRAVGSTWIKSLQEENARLKALLAQSASK